MINLHATFITMFREPIEAFLHTSIMGRAQQNKKIVAEVMSLLEEVNGNHHQIDDTPYGGGPGELMRVDVIALAIKKSLLKHGFERSKKRVILMDPAAPLFNQTHAQRLSKYDELIFVCGRYEGIDARIYHYVDEALSLGDFILSNGDMAALAMFDSIARMTEGFLGNASSVIEESHMKGRLEASHYTRPKEFEGYQVPLVYQNGHHQELHKAKTMESLLRTIAIRPDLIEKYPLSKEEEMLKKSAKPETLLYPWEKH